MLAAALLVGAPVAVSAEESRLVDGRGDMWSTGADGREAPAPESEQGDVTRMKTGYREDRIVVRLAFVDLVRSGSYAQYVVLVQGHRDREVREVVLTASPQHWDGRVRVYRKGGDVVADCQVRHRIDYDREVVRLRVPRSCLHRPGSVRVNANLARADSSGTFYTDNPHDGSARSTDWSPWVHRTR
jgi:hypothetical protein